MTAPRPQSYTDLLNHYRKMTAIEQTQGIMSWDQEVMMPKGGIDQRAKHMEVLALIGHEMATDPRIADWLNACEAVSLDESAQANIREARRQYQRAVRVPGKLAAQLAALTTKSQAIWADARANNDPSAFLPVLSDVIALKREEAAAVKTNQDNLYDVLLNDYELGASTATIEPIFNVLRDRIQVIKSTITSPTATTLAGHFSEHEQLSLAHNIAEHFGYDFARGRLDLSVHPFSSGNFDDSRITTRVDEADPLNCLYSTIHEVGHAVYEQNIDAALADQPIGVFCSMGIHESQSRMFENQIGRSEEFMGLLLTKMKTAFPKNALPDRPTQLWRAVNNIETGYIRTEADELHYNLHVMLRFKLEKV